MAIRNLRLEGDPILRKISRPIEEVNDKILELIEDMKETMYLNEGVGLAAPQIGVLKRLVIVDVGEGEDLGKGKDIPNGPIALINPEIIEQSGCQIGIEGCLSVPDMSGDVERPKKILVRAKNEKFEDIEFEASDFFARAICHEIDHLNGILYIDKLVEEDKK